MSPCRRAVDSHRATAPEIRQDCGGFCTEDCWSTRGRSRKPRRRYCRTGSEVGEWCRGHKAKAWEVAKTGGTQISPFSSNEASEEAADRAVSRLRLAKMRCGAEGLPRARRWTASEQKHVHLPAGAA